MNGHDIVLHRREEGPIVRFVGATIDGHKVDITDLSVHAANDGVCFVSLTVYARTLDITTAADDSKSNAHLTDPVGDAR